MATSASHRGARAPLFAGLVYVQLAAGMILFGSATPVSKLVTDAMPVFIGATLRVAIGALVLAPLLLVYRGEIAKLGRRDWLLTALIAVFGMFGFTVFMLAGMSLVSGVTGAVVMSTTPAVTAGVAILLLGEQANWRKLTAIALAVGGVLLLYVGGGTEGGSGGGGGGGPLVDLLRDLGGGALLGGLLVFAAVCCEVTYTLLGQRVSRDANPLVVAFLAAALAIPLFLPLAAWEWPRFDAAAVATGGWLAALWYGAGTLALGTWCWYSGIAKTEGTVAAAFMGLMPASALVLSYLLLGERFQWIHLAGFGIVFAGVLLMSWEHARMARKR
ncbi:DMT family transporter [Pelagibius sp. 7325]|uniref:DMT family transporter n=1 Tax=Pelagibius sp. 7325 TaxID=3131994 RepID=UPI0030EC18BD